MSQSAEVFLREVMFQNAIPMVVQGGDDVGGSELSFGCVSSLGCGGGGHDAEGVCVYRVNINSSLNPYRPESLKY